MSAAILHPITDWDGEDPLGARYVTVTHLPLDTPVRPWVQAISTVPAGEHVLDLGDRHPDLAGRGPELSEYATLFALRRELDARHERLGPPDEAQMLGVGHYRRYAVTRPLGAASDVYGMLRTDDFAALDDEALLPPPGTIALPTVVDVGQVLRQYGNQHVLRDLLVFFGTAIDLGVVDDPVVAAFLSQPTMVAAPTVGVYPMTWYLQTLRDLERVASAFEADGFVEHQGYQRRSVGFCLERLHALLLGQLLGRWDRQRVLAHRAVVVSDDLTYATGG